MKISEIQDFKIFCDLDGVLSDFSLGVSELTDGRKMEDFPLKKFWSMVYHAQETKPDMFPNGFYTDLKWMPGGIELWDNIKKYDPIILSGVPFGNWAKIQKTAWIQKYLQTDKIILCLAREKQEKAMQYLHQQNLSNAILIDDNEENIRRWLLAKGIGIHHVSTRETLRKLHDILTI